MTGCVLTFGCQDKSPPPCEETTVKGVANAPVSFGIFELTADRPLPDPDTILGPLAEQGYDGVDLGPVGFLGRGSQLQDRLRRHGLSLVGGWLDFPLADDDAFTAALPALDDALELFVAAAEVDPDRPPLPTLADSGSNLRREHPGGAAPGLGLDAAGWDRFATNLAVVADRVRATGLEPTFHHHACTYVETPAEIDTFLDLTDVDLTLDTGHLLLGGGDPLDGLARWGDRVNHVHLKDARRSVLDEVVKGRGDMRAVWAGRAFVPFGAGDLDIAGFMDALVAHGYEGWLVVEQDTLPAADETQDAVMAAAIADQRANREALRPWCP
jgi:inosose dehydratase